MKLSCWVRVAWRDDDLTEEGDWGMLLTIPVDGYLEGPSGPMPFRDVEWVEVSTNHIKGGKAGRTLEFIDIKDEILSGLIGTQLGWDLRESTWSKHRIFEDEPVQVLRFMNPFGPVSRT
ncbi:hypothetical protein ACO0LM_23375 [Undibacterium sp. Di26W]|uniref:hypothetical protein n=1 Tax=Undibacterium sp. Di26W TaxID=3413035 RepID=UPI003BF194B3